MISIAVVDDEQVFLDQISGFMSRYAQEKGQELSVTCFRDGFDISEDYKAKWDIIFLDIQMEHQDGLAAARRIRELDPDVVLIFITSLAKYAINGYEVNAFDFVLKPLSYPQFELRLNKAVKEAEKHRAFRYIYLKKYSDTVRVSTDDILYIEVVGHTLHYVTAAEVYEKRETIGNAEKELDGLSFARCGVSYLVNLKRVSRISGDNVLIGSTALPISRGRKKQFLQEFSDYLEAGY